MEDAKKWREKAAMIGVKFIEMAKDINIDEQGVLEKMDEYIDECVELFNSLTESLHKDDDN